MHRNTSCSHWCVLYISVSFILLLRSWYVRIARKPRGSITKTISFQLFPTLTEENAPFKNVHEVVEKRKKIEVLKQTKEGLLSTWHKFTNDIANMLLRERIQTSFEPLIFRKNCVFSTSTIYGPNYFPLRSFIIENCWMEKICQNSLSNSSLRTFVINHLFLFFSSPLFLRFFDRNNEIRTRQKRNKVSLRVCNFSSNWDFADVASNVFRIVEKKYFYLSTLSTRWSSFPCRLLYRLILRSVISSFRAIRSRANDSTPFATRPYVDFVKGVLISFPLILLLRATYLMGQYILISIQ